MQEDTSVWRYILDHVWVPLFAMVGALWVMLHNKIDGIRLTVDRHIEQGISKAEFNNHVEADERMQTQIAQRLSDHNAHINLLSDRMRDMEEKGHERHIELLNAIHRAKT